MIGEDKSIGQMPLFIIIGVITVVALVITVVLIISLNKKKPDDYMPVEDIEDERLLSDPY